MTLENCKKWLAHFEANGNKKAAADMRANIARKSGDVKPPAVPTIDKKKK